jgi:hypothetical protein
MTDEPNIPPLPAGVYVYPVSSDRILELSRAMTMGAALSGDAKTATRFDLMVSCLFLYYLLFTDRTVDGTAEAVNQLLLDFKEFADSMGRHAALLAYRAPEGKVS